MESDIEDEEKRDASLDEYGEHIRQNNLRLITLAECISKEVTFASACNELHHWCKDSRAFTSNFEKNLLEALQAAFKVCTQDGFDLQLVSELINTCFHARRSLSEEGALRVGRWYEQLRRKRASRAAKRKRKEERERRLVEESDKMNYEVVLPTPSSFIDSSFSIPSEEGLRPRSFHYSMWNQTGVSGAGPSSTPASAVPMQSPAFANQFAHMSPSFNQQRMMMGAVGGVGAAPTSNPSMPQGAMFAPMMGYPSGMAPPGAMMMPSPVPPAPAASAPSKKPTAAQMQAAAVAQQQQQHQMQQMHMQQQLQQRPILNPTQAPIGMPQGAVMSQQTRTPMFVFANGLVSSNHPIYNQLFVQYQQWNQNRMMQHQMMMQQQQQQQQQQAMAAAAAGGAPMAAPSPHFGQQPAMNPQGVPIATQTAPGQVRPLNGYGVPTPTMPMGGMMQPMMTPGGSQPQPTPSPGMTTAGGGNAPHVQRVGTPVPFGQLQQHGMQHPVICVPNPMAPHERTILRIDELMLNPIEMAHDEKLRKTQFNVSQEMLRKLSDLSSLEVHIRSWMRNDKSCRIFWHSANNEFACEIRLNGETMSIVRPNLPIVVDKRLLKEGPNELEIVEKSCVCLASFGMAIVERMNMRDAVQRIFNLPNNCDQNKDIERNKAKMREFISRESSDGQIRLPLFCPISKHPIRVPARSVTCVHTACFDLEPTLASSLESGIYQCPICKNPFQLNEVEVDHFVASITRETYQKSPAPLEVMVHQQTCNWQAIPREDSLARFQQAAAQSQQAYAQQYGMQPMQQMQQMQPMQHPMTFPSSFPTMQQQQQQQMPLQQLQPTQMNGRKRESSDAGGTALKRFKSESFVSVPTGRSPAPMIAPHSVAPSMMMMGGPATPMGSGMYGGGPPSVPASAMHHSMPQPSPHHSHVAASSPFNGVVHPSPMKDPSSHHSQVAASPMGSAMAPSTPYGSAGMGGMNGGMNQTALTCATDGGHVQPTSSAPYTPGSVDNKSNGMATVTANGAGPLSNPQMRAPSTALTPDTQASTSNASAEDEGSLRDSLSNIEIRELLIVRPELNLQDYLLIVGSLEAAKLSEDFDCYNFDTPPGSHASIAPPQSSEAWHDAQSIIGVPSSA